VRDSLAPHARDYRRGDLTVYYPNRQIRSLVLSVDLVGSRRI
jgi:hypothetical protein